MSDQDPIVLSQAEDTIGDRRIAAYQDMSRKYSHCLDGTYSQLSPLAKVWTAEGLFEIVNRLSVLVHEEIK